MKLRVIELFGGIGACSKAIERLGIPYEIADYVEIDKYAVKSFNAIVLDDEGNLMFLDTDYYHTTGEVNFYGE